jgi:hypothetical protein
MDIQCQHCESYLNIREVVTRCTECKELLNKTNNMKNNFKEGDKVFVAHYGWGIFEKYHQTELAIVNYENIPYCVNINYISFTEYTLQGFTQERPFEPKIGKKYFFWNDETINDDCVGYGKLKQISNNINFPYFFGTKYFQFCSETNPLL